MNACMNVVCVWACACWSNAACCYTFLLLLLLHESYSVWEFISDFCEQRNLSHQRGSKKLCSGGITHGRNLLSTGNSLPRDFLMAHRSRFRMVKLKFDVQTVFLGAPRHSLFGIGSDQALSSTTVQGSYKYCQKLRNFRISICRHLFVPAMICRAQCQRDGIIWNGCCEHTYGSHISTTDEIPLYLELQSECGVTFVPMVDQPYYSSTKYDCRSSKINCLL